MGKYLHDGLFDVDGGKSQRQMLLTAGGDVDVALFSTPPGQRERNRNTWKMSRKWVSGCSWPVVWTGSEQNETCYTRQRKRRQSFGVINIARKYELHPWLLRPRPITYLSTIIDVRKTKPRTLFP